MTAPKGRTALYRFYRDDGTLLYAGISNSPSRRRQEHELRKSWYPLVKHQWITWYDTRRQALRAEIRAIRTEWPEFNIAGAVMPSGRVVTEKQFYRAFAALWIAAALPFAAAALGVRPLADVESWAVSAGAVLALAVPVLSHTARIRRCAVWLDRNFGREGAYAR